MFIAAGPFFSPNLSRSAITFSNLGNVPVPHFAPKGAKSGRALVAINISLLWSEDEFIGCNAKLISALMLATFSVQSLRLLVCG